MPLGLIGVDWLVSYLANANSGIVSLTTQSPLVVFSTSAGFSFRSLNLLYPLDYPTNLKRLWRYALRGVQFEIRLDLLCSVPPLGKRGLGEILFDKSPSIALLQREIWLATLTWQRGRLGTTLHWSILINGLVSPSTRWFAPFPSFAKLLDLHHSPGFLSSTKNLSPLTLFLFNL